MEHSKAYYVVRSIVRTVVLLAQVVGFMGIAYLCIVALAV